MSFGRQSRLTLSVTVISFARPPQLIPLYPLHGWYVNGIGDEILRNVIT